MRASDKSHSELQMQDFNVALALRARSVRTQDKRLRLRTCRDRRACVVLLKGRAGLQSCDWPAAANRVGIRVWTPASYKVRR